MFPRERLMSEHPCSRDQDDGLPKGQSTLPKASELPVARALDKDNPDLWKGQTPGDFSHHSPDHHLVVTRAAMKKDDDFDGHDVQ